MFVMNARACVFVCVKSINVASLTLFFYMLLCRSLAASLPCRHEFSILHAPFCLEHIIIHHLDRCDVMDVMDMMGTM